METIEKTHVQRIELMDWTSGHTSTNFNPFRQRDLSRAQSAALSVAGLVAEGDLLAISAAAELDGRISGCELSQGYWEPQGDASWRRFGCSAQMCDERDARTVRVSCRSGRKAAWVELTYDDPADAIAVLAAVGVRAHRFEDWEREQAERAREADRAMAEGRDGVYADIPF